ncbi:MAG: MFS transporter [Thermoplasmataceae archaeon]
MTVLRNRNFLVLWISQTISNSGDVIFALAVIWYVLISTKSILLVGLIVASSFLPDILIAPFAGTCVDRFNRRSVLMVSYIIQSILVGGAGILYIFHDLGFAFSLVTVLGLGIGEQFVTPAYSAMLPRVVGREELMPANGLISSTSSLNMLGSNAVGGLMIVFLGMGAPFEYDAITFVIAAAFLVILPRVAGTVEKIHSQEKSAEFKVSTVSEMRDGYHYLRKDRLLLRLAVLSTIVSFFALGLQGIYAPYVQDNLHGGTEIYGLFLSAFALGSIVGSLVIGHFGRNARTGRLIVLGLIWSGNSHNGAWSHTFCSYCHISLGNLRCRTGYKYNSIPVIPTSENLSCFLWQGIFPDVRYDLYASTPAHTGNFSSDR